MKRLVVAIACLMLPGCFTCNNPVKIPVAIPCHKPVLQPKPALPVLALTQESKPSAIMQAYVASVQLQDNYIEYLLKAAK